MSHFSSTSASFVLSYKHHLMSSLISKSSIDSSSVNHIGRHRTYLSSAFDYNIFLAAEQLRYNLKTSKILMIKDRKYHLRTYKCCFVGFETVDWLLHHGESDNRETAVAVMQLLLENGIIHHVCDDHQYKDEYLFYRFRLDDGTYPPTDQSEAILFGFELYQLLLSTRDENTVFGDHIKDGHTFPNSFIGCEVVQWLIIQESLAKCREFLVSRMKDLIDYDVIRHVTGDHHFQDNDHLYEFCREFTQKRSLAGLLLQNRGISETRMMNSLASHPTNSTTVKSRRYSVESAASSSSQASIERESSDAISEDEISLETVRQKNAGKTPKPIIYRSVSVEELEEPNSPYVKKNILIQSDAVGYGFVLRGCNPAYVQTIDPAGPAAAAGLKVRHLIAMVNGTNVLRLGHRQVSDIILRNDSVNLVIMVHFRDASM
ncbi:DEP domain-containing mTOR-interacting protein-like [Tubulanus polymorphus]|uniref:DEP domain-containing mTOR-interacting protein-like n=1 Tax=Tubulanus polymorphus TaxID=672921 RepID=UPI003DA3D243